MGSSNNNIHAALNGGQDKKVRAQVLGRETPSKSKLQSQTLTVTGNPPTQLVKRLGRQMG